MRVALTGASGFLGGYVLDSLVRRGIETVVLGRSKPAHGPFSAFVEVDLLGSTDLPSLFRATSATHLLHLAWYTEHGAYWTSPLNGPWAAATARLVQAFCEAGGQGVVLAGTCAEYDWTEGLCREDHTALQPASLYGRSKDEARRLTLALCDQYQVPCAWGRVFFPYGAGEDRRRLIPALIDAFLGRRPAFGVNARAQRDFLHASDVAEGFLALLESGANGAYNLCSGEPVQVAWVVREVARLLAADPEQVLGLVTERPGEPALLVGENLKLRSLGWQPMLSLQKGLERSVSETGAPG